MPPLSHARTAGVRRMQAQIPIKYVFFGKFSAGY